MSNDFSGMSAPMDAGDDFREPPKWPKVVGILSIVFGALNLVCNGIGSVFAFLTPTFMKSAEAQSPGGFPPSMTAFNPLMAGLMVVSLCFGVLLLLAGIMTLNRRAVGRPMHIVYSLGAIVMLVVGIVMQLQQIDELAAWVRDNPDAAFSQQWSPITTYVSMAIGIVIGGGYPVFCLVWFGAMGKRPEIDAPEVL